jgi:RHS repeat-associated protein
MVVRKLIESLWIGAGWTFSGIESLVTITADSYGPAGMLRLYGIGGWRFYQGEAGGPYTSPGGDNGTLVKSGSGWVYSTPDGQSRTFNGSGYQTQWTSSDGQETLQYRYDGSNKLTGYTDTDGTSSTFQYDGSGMVGTIQTGTPTVTWNTLLSYDNASPYKNLTRITDPDGGVDTFSYDGSNRVTGETYGQLQQGWAYTAQGTVGTYTWGNGSSPSTLAISPLVLQGITVGLPAPVQASVTDADGNSASYQFDAQGRPLLVTADDGGQTVYSYDNNAFLTAVTDPLGRTTSYALDSKKYVTKVTFADSTSLTYQYQDSATITATGLKAHELTTFTNERGNTTTFAYDGSAHQTSVTDALGKTTVGSYSSSGLLTRVTDPLTHTTSFRYDGLRRPSTVTDPLSDVTTFSYADNGYLGTLTNARGNASLTSYTLLGRLTTSTDAEGHTTTIGYDAAGLVTKVTDPQGNVTSVVYDSYGRGLVAKTTVAVGTQAQATTLLGYDAAGRLTQVRDARGGLSAPAYDGVGRVVSATDAQGGVSRAAYDLAGEVTAVRDALGRWATMTYDLRGRLSTTTDNLGQTTTISYDPAGNVTRVTDPLGITRTAAYDALDRATSVTDGRGKTSTSTFDDAGNLSTTTDPDGLVTSYVYDAANRVTQTTVLKPGSGLSETMTTSYDAVGNVTAQTDGLGHTTTSVFDKADRLTNVIDPLSHTTTLALDAADNVTRVIDALGKTTTINYDAQNRQVSVIDPLGHTSTTVFDAVGNAVAVIDPLRDPARTVYDLVGRPVATIDAKNQVTQVGYDPSGAVTAVTDSVGNSTGYLYDRLGRQSVVTDPAGARTTTTWDADSRVSTVTDRLSRQQLFSYNNDHQVTTIVWKSSGGTAVNTLTYAYDDAGNLTSAGDNTGGTFTYSYDALERATQYTNVFGQVLTYSYDLANRVTQRSDSLGGVLTSVYDNADRLTSRQFGGTNQTPVRVDFGYDARNEQTSITRFSDLGGSTVVGTTVYGFDDAGRTIGITHKNGSNATLSYYNYSFDNADRVTSETRYSQPVGTVTTSYGYDTTNQLTSDGTHTYSYDASGNRTSVVTSGPATATYQTGTANRVTSDGVWTYTYDAEGNLINKRNISSGDLWTYSYDTWNRLTNASGPVNGVSFSVTYVYDVEGHRVAQIEQGTATSFAYDGDNVWADLDSSNHVQFRYLYGDSTDQILTRTQGTGVNATVTAYLTDRLGSVRDLEQFSNQTIVGHRDYDGYGNLVLDTAPSVSDRYGFTGREADPNTKLQYNRARYYDPTTGRWLSEDPLSFYAGDGNLYRYVGNGPTNALDPNGLWQLSRRGQSAAGIVYATSDKDDTMAGLAERVGLRTDEFRKWATAGSLKLTNGDSVALDALGSADELCAGQKVGVPNEILFVWMGWGGKNSYLGALESGLGTWGVGWYNDMEYLKNLGFNVTELHYDPHKYLGIESRFTQKWLDTLKADTKSRVLHGMEVTGHGNWFRCSSHYGHKVVVDYSEMLEALQYHLGFLILNVCDSKRSHKDPDYPKRDPGERGGMDLGSGVGKFGGVRGTCVPPFSTSHPSDILKPGDQGTSP